MFNIFSVCTPVAKLNCTFNDPIYHLEETTGYYQTIIKHVPEGQYELILLYMKHKLTAVAILLAKPDLQQGQHLQQVPVVQFQTLNLLIF